MLVGQRGSGVHSLDSLQVIRDTGHLTDLSQVRCWLPMRVKACLCAGSRHRVKGNNTPSSVHTSFQEGISCANVCALPA